MGEVPSLRAIKHLRPGGLSHDHYCCQAAIILLVLSRTNCFPVEYFLTILEGRPMPPPAMSRRGNGVRERYRIPQGLAAVVTGKEPGLGSRSTNLQSRQDPAPAPEDMRVPGSRRLSVGKGSQDKTLNHILPWDSHKACLADSRL